MAKKYTKLSEILRTLLFERNMKAVDLAREVDLPQPTVHRLVTGKSTRPYKSSLKPIADYFDITVEQLVGEKSLAAIEARQSTQTLSDSKIKNIPIVAWNEAGNLKQATEKTTDTVVVGGNVSADSFALIMPDYSMEPLFPKGAVLIFDPKLKETDRCFALVKLHNTATPVFRQLLIDADHQYLKPLNPDLNAFQMRLLDKNDTILACLLESRYQHQAANTLT
jgi:SOS-response transcriptional repressor LexA